MSSAGISGTWSIGELAEHAGVTVKTVRFYSDRGLLPEAARSAGGHRRYGPEALDRLRLIRSLRTLDLPVPEVGRVLERSLGDEDALDEALEDAVAGRLSELGPQLAALRWREAALMLLRDCPPGERADRLRLIGAVSAPPGTQSLARFWRRWLPPRLPARVVSEILDRSVPQPPADPAPAQVLAFARLHAFVSRDCPGPHGANQPAAHRTDEGYRPAVLYDGLAEAHDLTAVELRAGRPPRQGGALDCFVSAYARSRGVRDTPAFRRELSGQLAADPRIDHYWRLVAEVTAPPSGGPPEPTPGAAHDWLCAALAAQTAGHAGPAGGASQG
ncbi:helix-turn-helix domain-containing protein [Streptomyces sp. MUM 178J]|uniref:helix-turn-helix domain-containing protein n=1 Tax=Streptomyces sp. MUM 178J TaxID=2791991 RepID=UPI001F043F9A|nr:MerR family transcriptional regulator [Streptomyces sp. MUM 178J]WRQ79314.1 MerR family transcriptional regulator [Streptomyces sp. MUM 178J]